MPWLWGPVPWGFRCHSITGSGWTAGWLGPAVTSLHWGDCSLYHRLRLDCRVAGASYHILAIRGCSLHHGLRLDCRMAGASSDIPALRGCSLHHGLRLDCRMAGASCDIPSLRGLLTLPWAQAGLQDGWGQQWHPCTEGLLTPSWAQAGLQDGWVQLWHPCTEGAAHFTIGSGWTAGWLGPAVTSLYWGGCSLHHGLGLDCRMAGSSCDIPPLRGLLTPP